MKKLFLIIVACSLLGVANAQYKPEAGKISLEVGFIPFSANETPINSLGLKARYFLNENMAVRLNMPMEMVRTKTSEMGGLDNKIEQVTKNSSTHFAILPGIEYHLGSWEKVSPYFGAELGIGILNSSSRISNLGFVDGDKQEIKGPNSFGFNFAALAGVDWYIAQGLYVGVEFGLGFQTMKEKASIVTTTTGNITTTVDPGTYKRDTDFGFNTQAAIRLGWVF